jgi:hypothetical protein
MKSYSKIRKVSNEKLAGKNRNQVIQKICQHFKRKCSMKQESASKLPPKAPHNTSQFIMNSHRTVLSDVEELLGSAFLLQEIQV